MGTEGARPHDGEIKAAPPEGAKPLTWLGSLRGVRSARVPLARRSCDFSKLFPALAFQKRPEGPHSLTVAMTNSMAGCDGSASVGAGGTLATRWPVPAR